MLSGNNLTVMQSGVKPVTSWSQVQRPYRCITTHLCTVELIDRFDWQLEKMSTDEMVPLFQQILHDVVGQMFKPDKVWYAPWIYAE